MHFLSKIFLGVEVLHRAKICDDYSIHRLVYSLFPRTGEPRARFLYADKGPVQGGRMLLILSETEPVWPDDIQSSTTILSEQFLSLKNYRFEVELNPVRRASADGKRRAVIGQLELLQWFMEHAPRWGFQADSRTLEVFVRPSKVVEKDGRSARFNRALFKGTLQVTDQELFQQSCFAGLGHGKAFGFGLLQLQPICPIHLEKEI